MKKLMIAMGAAAMMSLCANAVPTGGTSLGTGTDFNSYSGDWDPENADDGSGVGKVYWTGGSGDSSSSEIAVKDDQAQTPDKYLKVDEEKALTRLIDVNGGVASNATVSADSGIYFSSKVQFTAADDAPEVTEDVDKIIVWAKAPADDADPGTTTNLMVTALDLVGGTNKVYDTGVPITADQWYTLDIVAAAQNADSPIAFTVSLDGRSVGTFNSMVLANITGADTISSASFKGTGAVDDIDWGTVAVVAPIPLTVEAYNMSVSYTVDGGAATTYADNANIPASAQTLTFTVTPASGYIVTNAIAVVAGESEPVALAVVNNTLTIDVATYTTDDGIMIAFEATEVGDKTLIEASNVTLSSDSAEYTAGMQFPEVTVTVGGEPLTEGTDYTLTWDPGSITQAGIYTATVEGTGSYYGTVEKTFTVTAPQSDKPQVGGNDCATGEAFVAAATSGTVNTLPSGWTVDGNVVKDGTGATFATFPAFYNVTLTGTTLTLELNNNALATMTAVTVGETFGLSVSASDTKLYYGLSSSTTVTGEYTAPTVLTRGTGSALTIPAAKSDSGNQCFYKLYVTDIAPAPAQD